MLIWGDNLEKLKKMSSCSIDAVVTDPPYGLAFMGKRWDYDVPTVEFWAEVYRVLKPGGHVLSFGGTRTYHRMAVNIEDAGFEIRDQLQWLYGSGFPKSHNISKGIDKKFGAEREIVGISPNNRDRSKHNYNSVGNVGSKATITAPATPEAEQWNGWGTALKPSNEPICLARKPLSEKTIVDNILKWGCGGLNIDDCRIGMRDAVAYTAPDITGNAYNSDVASRERKTITRPAEGRWPANTLFDYAASEMLDEQSGISKSTGGGSNRDEKNPSSYSFSARPKIKNCGKGDVGGASRFFYVAKASKSERGPDNNHPTVKPIKLMQYLCRLITPPGGTVLDPFMGSGTTGLAAYNDGFNFVGIEREKQYFDIAKERIEKCRVDQLSLKIG